MAHSSLPAVFPYLPPPTLASLLHRCRYRARVERVESAAKVHVFYIDYGNVSTNSWAAGGAREAAEKLERQEKNANK